MIYLATVYRKHPDGIEDAYRMACEATAKLWMLGREVYSPIAHSHGVAIHGGLDPMGYEIYRKQNMAMMELCDEIWVLTTEGWTESEGIADEMKFFLDRGIQVRFVRPQDLGL